MKRDVIKKLIISGLTGALSVNGTTAIFAATVAKTGTETEVETNTEAQTEAETQTETEAETEADPGSETDTENEMGDALFGGMDAITNIDWSDYQDLLKDREDFEGRMTKVGDTGLKIYLPKSFEAQEITDTLADEGFLAYYMLDEDHGVGVQTTETDGEDDTLQDYLQALKKDEEIDDAEIKQINGLEAVVYIIPDEEGETTVVSLEGEPGELISFLFTPTDEEAFAEMAEIMEASIQGVK